MELENTIRKIPYYEYGVGEIVESKKYHQNSKTKSLISLKRQDKIIFLTRKIKTNIKGKGKHLFYMGN